MPILPQDVYPACQTACQTESCKAAPSNLIVTNFSNFSFKISEISGFKGSFYKALALARFKAFSARFLFIFGGSFDLHLLQYNFFDSKSK